MVKLARLPAAQIRDARATVDQEQIDETSVANLRPHGQR